MLADERSVSFMRPTYHGVGARVQAEKSLGGTYSSDMYVLGRTESALQVRALICHHIDMTFASL
jgi:hypothetical protein